MAVVNRRLGVVLTAAPGTGSTSLLDLFGRLPGSRMVPTADVVADGITVLDAKHATVAELEHHGVLPPADRRCLRVVTSTRNPFDFWPAEWWRTRTRWAESRGDPDSWVHRQPGMLQRINEALAHPFGVWLAHALGADARSGRTMHLNDGHVSEADFVVRMENMATDLEQLLDADFVATHPVPHINETGGHRPYQQWYDETSRELVARVHAPDLARFGYAFCMDG